IIHDTPSEPLGPWVLPGAYTVRLSVNGQLYTEPLIVKMDPRVTTSPEGLEQQYALSMQCYRGMLDIHQATEAGGKHREQLKTLRELLAKVKKDEKKSNGSETPPSPGTSISQAIESFDDKLADLLGAERPRRRGGRRRTSGQEKPTLSRIGGDLGTLL